MAETLFRQWFVEEAREDWEEGVLSDEFDFTMGQSPPGSSYNQEGIGMPMFQGNADFVNGQYSGDFERFVLRLETIRNNPRLKFLFEHSNEIELEDILKQFLGYTEKKSQTTTARGGGLFYLALKGALFFHFALFEQF